MITEYLKKYYPRLLKSESGLVDVYSDMKTEYNYIRHSVGIRDISKFKTYKLKGKDTVDFIGRLSTNDVSSAAEDKAVNTIFTNAKGRVIDRTKFVKSGDSFILLSARTDDALHFWLEKYIIMEELEIFDISGSYSKLKLLGTQAESFLTFLIGEDIEKLENGQAVTTEINGANIILIKDEYAGKISAFYLISALDSAGGLIDALLAVDNVFDIGFVGEKAYEPFRIEAGRPVSPNELNDNFNPHELNLTSEISFTKGCYIGQEVIARLETYQKIQKKLIGVVFSNSNKPKLNSKIFVNGGTEVGTVTSVSESPYFSKIVGLAVLRKEYSEPGTNLIAEDGSEFTVFPLPIKL